MQSFTDKVIPVHETGVIIPYVVLLFIRDRADGGIERVISIPCWLSRLVDVGLSKEEGGGAGPAGRVSGRLCISRLAIRAVKDERGTGIGPIDEGVGEQQKPRGRNRNLGWFFIGGSVFEAVHARNTLSPYRPAASLSSSSSLAPPRETGELTIPRRRILAEE